VEQLVDLRKMLFLLINPQIRDARIYCKADFCCKNPIVCFHGNIEMLEKTNRKLR